jgi:deazaflavin-dependent oxidoreductase (nitroreductase family)
MFDELVARLAQWRLITWFLLHTSGYIYPVLTWLSGAGLSLTGNRHIVVLRHRGEKTGKPRQTPLLYFTLKEEVILVASNGGSRRHPGWYHNIQANPEVSLWVGKRGGLYRARVASEQERAAIWPLATSFYSGFVTYQRLTVGRQIPVVICSPVTSAQENGGRPLTVPLEEPGRFVQGGGEFPAER